VTRVLDPIARVSEILFGLIMALTFTGTLGAATAGREEVRTLLVGAIGCNIAWGLVDAVMFLMSSLTERGRGLLTIRAVHSAASPQQAHGVIAGAVPPVLAKVLSENDLESMRQGLLRMGELPPRGLEKRDWLGALAVFLLVFLSTFPVVIPFLVVQDVQLALRLSNLVAIAMMFVCGILLGRHGGYHPWRTGFSVVLLGVLLVGITIVLGG
jgi:VIT1/CCC1 family predicted Fe2+/Mn2+ transporter